MPSRSQPNGWIGWTRNREENSKQLRVEWTPRVGQWETWFKRELAAPLRFAFGGRVWSAERAASHAD